VHSKKPPSLALHPHNQQQQQNQEQQQNQNQEQNQGRLHRRLDTPSGVDATHIDAIGCSVSR
jgi:hypothetical protein